MTTNLKRYWVKQGYCDDGRPAVVSSWLSGAQIAGVRPGDEPTTPFPQPCAGDFFLLTSLNILVSANICFTSYSHRWLGWVFRISLTYIMP